ncbi:MAG: hypothetical protein AVDCRST_MAG73-3224 [uncultured Thermomicrobiales bacterium]|uniref:Ribonuclease VapC n=1 Tax=uncultured Thermomicrobiales bacterium TaxID=1645740 RepID=A0A6J4UMK2_9BACT|nr:MAG: hypothetical protein AVDCRST_MAG73-3224 [uncultured Thermomicrobiales bacterium]
MGTLQKVQARGQITLTSELRREVGIDPGDTVLLRATKPHIIELTVLPRLTLAEALKRYRIDGPVDVAVLGRTRRRRWSPTRCWASMDSGLLDTNVVIHAQTTDGFSAECQAFLAALERGDVRARLEPPVLHELTYTLPRLFKQMDRAQVAAYLIMVVGWPGVETDKAVLVDTIHRWAQTSGLGFVDAYLAAVAAARRCPVYTKNARDFASKASRFPIRCRTDASTNKNPAPPLAGASPLARSPML